MYLSLYLSLAPTYPPTCLLNHLLPTYVKTCPATSYLPINGTQHTHLLPIYSLCLRTHQLDLPTSYLTIHRTYHLLIYPPPACLETCTYPPTFLSTYLTTFCLPIHCTYLYLLSTAPMSLFVYLPLCFYLTTYPLPA